MRRGQPGKQTNRLRRIYRERGRGRDKPIQWRSQRETLGGVSNGVICDRHARANLPKSQSQSHTHNACPAINMGPDASPTIHSNPIAATPSPSLLLEKFLARSYSWAPLVFPACFMTVFVVEIKLQFQTSLASFIFMGFALCHALLQVACSPFPLSLCHARLRAMCSKSFLAKWINAIGIGRYVGRYYGRWHKKCFWEDVVGLS